MNVIVVGGGKIGSSLAGLLIADGHRVKLIERRAEIVEGLVRTLPSEVPVHGDGTDPDVLEAIGARNCDAVAAVTGVDETNLVVANLARLEFGVPRTVARINHPRNAWMFTPQMGVDVGLDQSSLTARLVLEELSLDGVTALLELHGGEYVLVEEQVNDGAQAAHRAVRDLALPNASAITAVIRGEHFLVSQPDVVLEPGDRVLVLVKTVDAQRLTALFGATSAKLEPTRRSANTSRAESSRTH